MKDQKIKNDGPELSRLNYHFLVENSENRSKMHQFSSKTSKKAKVLSLAKLGQTAKTATFLQKGD